MHLSFKATPRSRKAGMTLVEIMVAMSIGVVVIGGATWFLFEGTRASYRATAQVENSIQQWGLAAKLQIDGKIADNVTILGSADTTTWTSDLPKVIPVDDGDATNGLERGKMLVLTKCERNQGIETNVITDLIFYLYTGSGGSAALATGTLKRYPAKAPESFAITTPIDPDTGQPKTVAQLVSENFDTFTGGAALVQDNLVSVATDGPFASFGDGRNVSIALVREETALGTVKSSNLTEVSFNLR